MPDMRPYTMAPTKSAIKGWISNLTMATNISAKAKRMVKIISILGLWFGLKR